MHITTSKILKQLNF